MLSLDAMCDKEEESFSYPRHPPAADPSPYLLEASLVSLEGAGAVARLTVERNRSSHRDHIEIQ